MIFSSIHSKTRSKLHPEVTHRIPDCDRSAPSLPLGGRGGARLNHRHRFIYYRALTFMPHGAGSGADPHLAVVVSPLLRRLPDVSRQTPTAMANSRLPQHSAAQTLLPLGPPEPILIFRTAPVLAGRPCSRLYKNF